MPASSIIADKHLAVRRLALLGLGTDQISSIVGLSSSKFDGIVKEVLSETGKKRLTPPGPRKFVKNLMSKRSGVLEASVFINIYINLRGLDNALSKINVDDLIESYRQYLVVRTNVPKQLQMQEPLDFQKAAVLVRAILTTDYTVDDLENSAIVHECKSKHCGAYYYTAIGQNISDEKCPFCKSEHVAPAA